MRKLIVLATLCGSCIPEITLAGHTVEMQLDFADADVAGAKSEVAAEYGPINKAWDVKGVEKTFITPYDQCGSCRMIRWVPRVKAPSIDRKEVFAGMWTTESMLQPSSHCRIPSEHLPLTVPPFEPGSLAADLWPCTRNYLTASEDKASSSVLCEYVW